MRLLAPLACTLVLALAGCASVAPPPSATTAPPVSASVAERAAQQAASMIGKRYRYGGASPSTGFDCSGLVHFSYRRAGAAPPRTTEAQLAGSRPVKLAQLRRGDLLFFNQEGKRYGHVGIYLGRGMFVHAPSSGKTVRSDRLESPYWKRHLSEARRLALN